MTDTLTTELGLEVAAAEAGAADYREHTARNWLLNDPDGYGRCVELIRQGQVNQSELARLFGCSRNTIHALMFAEFTAKELHEIKSKLSAVGTVSALGKLTELVDVAKSSKDIGGVAMALTALNNVDQLSSGGPTEIKRVEHLLSWEDFQKNRPPEPPVVDVEAVGNDPSSGTPDVRREPR